VEGEGKERARSPCRGCNHDACCVALRGRECDQNCRGNAGMRNHADGAIWMGQIFKSVSMSNLKGPTDEDQRNA
jgi:hypothetical protein